ncbi:MAG: tRNA (adenosine(37)-N6)-threonylcarbamoyltransferase complex transferase subunit TsaD [Acidobacteria bacterium]|nr:tRNA (adenosine(37)-N6)-threonylcarbamoyltransferase complex transferase subunit TsaD [Acidobacteriota bacterium]
MYLLGIETSCDETAAAVVESGERILSNVVASQFDVHRRYGGVVPELASREHLRAIVPVVRQAVEEAGLAYRDLGAVAVTCGPGLVGSLLVGVSYAKALSLSLGVPLIGVNHIEGHIHAVVLEQKPNEVPFPSLALVASGGHTHMFYVHRIGEGDYRYELLGRTRDDAAGEAFDKVAKLLGFSYPGGPIIDRLASYGNPEAIRFTVPRMKGNELDFSFSGLKTAVLRHVQAAGMEAEIARRRELARSAPGGRPTLERWLEATPQPTLDLVASFQQAVTEELVRHALRAAVERDVRSLIISGGVASNSRLRQRFSGQAVPYPVYFPSLRLSTDNAAMIAAAAYPKFLSGRFSDLSLAAEASLAL